MLSNADRIAQLETALIRLTERIERVEATVLRELDAIHSRHLSDLWLHETYAAMVAHEAGYWSENLAEASAQATRLGRRAAHLARLAALGAMQPAEPHEPTVEDH
jgi:hypothetical protein